MPNMRRLIIAVVLLSFMLGSQYAFANSNQAPEGAEIFAEEHFLPIVKEVVFTDIPSEWGFKEEMGSITFSDLYPVYRLNADFAFGESDRIITDEQPMWIAVIFQDQTPVNAIGTQLQEDGSYGLSAIGYPQELPSGLLKLQDDERLIYDAPAEEYYVVSDKVNSIYKLTASQGKSAVNSIQSQEQFQNMLMKRYEHVDELSSDSSGGFVDTVPVTTEESNYFILYFVLVLVAGTSIWLFVRSRAKSGNHV